MKNPKNQPAERGLALVVVVSLMALLTVMILGLLMLSSNNRATANNDVSARQAENIAKAAVNTVIADIYDEFAIGATVTNVDAVQKVYTVTNPASMVPNKALRDSTLATATGFENLVKQSAFRVNFATGIASRASGISTDTASSDGRMISPATWAKAQLAPAPATNQVPQWVYLTRNGSNPTDYNAANKDATATNTDFVVGRYAYQVYDVGGLLDANVALSRDSDNAAGKDTKNSPYWAVAAALPGGTNALGDLLADWRHPVGKDPSTLVEWGERKGWNEVFNNGTASDQAFLSRQDLIAFQKANASVFPASLLPYFTHANFSLNQSGHVPDPNRPQVVALNQGGNNAQNLDNQINPTHLSVRSAIPNETNPTTRPTVPVAARRFPLDRLNLVVPNPSDTARVSQFFGLTYDPGNGEWTYAGSSINRLSAVAALNREPNLFELLKGTIHLGTLGGWALPRNGGSPAAGNNDHSVDRHIVQLVANLIDQWDSDHYPTVINFDDGGVDTRFVGIEDLPRIYAVGGAGYRIVPIDPSTFVGSQAGPPPSSYGAIYECAYLMQPIIWNPHIPSANANPAPTNFRIIAISNPAGSAANVSYQLNEPDSNWLDKNNIRGNVRYTSDSVNYTVANGKNYSINQLWNESNAYITFNTTATGAASFREPYPLKSEDYPAGSNALGPEKFTKISPQDGDFPTSEEDHAIGFFAGKFWMSQNRPEIDIQDPAYPTDPTRTIKTRIGLPNIGRFLPTPPHSPEGVRYHLQYKTSSDSWITYDTFKTIGGHEDISTEFTLIHTRIDPRSSRLGVFSTNAYRSQLSAGTIGQTWLHGDTTAPQKPDYIDIPKPTVSANIFQNGRAIGEIYISNWNVSSALGESFGNFHNSNLYPKYFQMNRNNGNGSYSDPDNITRPAMGVHASGADGFPLTTAARTTVNSRPRILNRPFRSVAELGYVFRDLPWRQFDFNNPESPDGALLEVFCLHSEPGTYETPRVLRGRVNLNSARSEVIQALVRGTAVEPSGSALLSNQEATNIGDALSSWVRNTSNPNQGPFRSRADMVGVTVSGNSKGFSSTISTKLTGTNVSVSERRDAVVRALADSSDTRTWNLMVDVIAQAGQLTNSATTLDQFNVRGQTHHWVFLSIDRLTGEIIHQSSEIVKE